MKHHKVLIVEDESIVAMEIESYVQKLGYVSIGVTTNGKATLNRLQEEEADIILMDIHLKGEMDGIDTADIIKNKFPLTQIIFLTAHMDDYNVSRAIHTDPVAYLSKPFHREELKVALQIASGKIENVQPNRHIPSHYITLDEEYCYDTRKHLLYCCSEPMHLTAKEQILMDMMIRYKNKVIDNYTIANEVWPDKITDPNTVRTLIRRLREKLKHRFIKTIPTQGYILHLP